ncbi:MAG: zinc-ribbon domain-containing protein [Butyrivibrio sp.]|nr:zinc-ribbon domain-containing protein [Butyrivibrio sp.]
MFCKNCGAKISDNASFCPKCGTKLVKISNDNASNCITNRDRKVEKNKTIPTKLLIAGAIAILVIACIVSVIAVKRTGTDEENSDYINVADKDKAEILSSDNENAEDSYSDDDIAVDIYSENSGGNDIANSNSEEDADNSESAKDKVMTTETDSYDAPIENPNKKIYESYLEIVQNAKDVEWDNFALIDFDGDDIPELFATCLNENNESMQLYMLQPYMIVGHNDDGVVINDDFADGAASAGGYRGTIYYLPGIGKFHDSAEYAPYGGPADRVYAMNYGKIEKTGDGYFEVDENSIPQGEIEDFDITDYGSWHWNGQVVGKEEYSDNLRSAIENTKGKALCEISCVDKDEMISNLENMTTSNETNTGFYGVFVGAYKEKMRQ